MSLAIAVRIAGSSVRSIAGRRPPARAARGSRRRRPSRRSPSRRCRARAACRRASKLARSAAAAPISASRVLGQRLRAQRADLVAPSSAPSGARRRRPARARVSRSPRNGYRKLDAPASWTRRALAALRAGRGARRTRARAPTARGRASRPAPGGCTGRSSAARTPTRRRRGENAIVRQPRARASASARAASPPSSSAPNAIAMSSGSASSSTCAPRSPPSPASPIAGSARLPTITGMDELDRDVAGVRARRRRAPERDQPPAAGEALGHQVAQPREPLGLARRRTARSPRCARSSSACEALGADRRRAPPLTPRPPRARRSADSHSRHASTPSPVRALTTIRSTSGWTWSML